REPVRPRERREADLGDAAAHVDQGADRGLHRPAGAEAPALRRPSRPLDALLVRDPAVLGRAPARRPRARRVVRRRDLDVADRVHRARRRVRRPAPQVPRASRPPAGEGRGLKTAMPRRRRTKDAGSTLFELDGPRAGDFVPRILAGLDEAGFGPLLGPLTIGCVALRSADGPVDPWDRLAGAVSRATHGA